jgi:hypothetical protein
MVHGFKEENPGDSLAQCLVGFSGGYTYCALNQSLYITPSVFPVKLRITGAAEDGNEHAHVGQAGPKNGYEWHDTGWDTTARCGFCFAEAVGCISDGLDLALSEMSSECLLDKQAQRQLESLRTGA